MTVVHALVDLDVKPLRDGIEAVCRDVVGGHVARQRLVRRRRSEHADAVGNVCAGPGPVGGEGKGGFRQASHRVKNALQE